MQRFLDIMLSAGSLFILSPLLIVVIVILRLTGEGEVFFRQSRIGLGGRKFDLIKFATMLKNSPNMATGTVTVRGDPRVLPVGRLLRKTKINELPQLLNVFRGDMSIIGPRPQTQRCFDAFPKVSQTQIVKVRPGLSGIGSIVFREEEEMLHMSGDPDYFYDNVIMPYKGLLEQWYVSNRSFWLYIQLIFITCWVVLNPNSNRVWRRLPDIPAPPMQLAESINWSSEHDI